jgi:hypothetical protein
MITIILTRINYVFIHQVKFFVWACLPGYVTVSVPIVYLAVALIAASYHYDVAKVAVYEV